MWNHAQNCSPKGDEDTNEADPNLRLKERIEKSLDLSQYLKYLDQLFGQATSDSDSSDSDDGGKSRTFTEFRQPPVTAQPHDRPQHGHSRSHLLLGGPSSVSDSCNLVHSFTALKPPENFHLESNISSSSLSSIDSGTSSLSLNLSSETGYLESSHGKVQSTENGVTKSTDIRASTVGTEEDKSSDKGEKDKKSQKKKKAGRSSNETFPRQHKPSSGGKGNNGPKGGGGSGGAAPGGGGSSSNDNSGGSSGSSSNQNISGNSGSPGAKGRSGKQQSLQKQTDSHLDNVKAAADMSSKYNKDNMDCNDNSANVDLQRALGIMNSNTDSLLLNEDLVDSFESEDAFDTSAMSSFPLNSILDNIPDEETSISDLISMSASLHATNSASASQFSTNFFSNIAQSAAACGAKTLSSSKCSESDPNSNNKMEGKKRKLENKREQPHKLSKLTEKQKQSRIEYLNAKRRKIYVYISRKEVVKLQKTRTFEFKEALAIRRKLAQACARQVKKNAIQSQKSTKESVCKAKRLTQEMEVYWRSVEKSERDLQRQVEKEAEDKLKKDVNVLNRIRNGKLNCLITQIELFVNKLLNKTVIEVNEDDLVSAGPFEGANQINLDSLNRLKSSVYNSIDRAVKEHRSLVKLLDTSGIFLAGNTARPKVVEPSVYKVSDGFLRNHQIFGINWIRNLYNKGLNGILADESGLGKKVQVTGFLSQLAESYDLWGPFLIVTPSTSISSWQQEFTKMCLKFKVVPYCGKPMERKILRQGWDKNGIHTEDAGFHVVLTSYQVMAADLKYFSKTKWQYLIMDDPQNVVTSSTKWMALLSFRCRNKLLLCGNPRLNSFRHLCSYLYFIMPSLFDSQKELSNWLLMELESVASSNVSTIEEDKSNTLKRLQEITQNFILRRELKDVEVETTPTVDVQLNCTLTKRQRQIYTDLLEQADLRSIVTSLERCEPAQVRAQMMNVLNLSFQLRKVCNHPDLIEERDFLTSFWMEAPFIRIPHIIYQNGLLNQSLKRLFCIYNPLNVYNSVFRKTCASNTRDELSTWSFVRLLHMDWKEVEDLFLGGNAARLNHLVNFRSVLERVQYDASWLHSRESVCFFNYPSALLYNFLIKSKAFSPLVFASRSPFVGSWRKCKNLKGFTTIEYRTLKSKSHFQGLKNRQNTQTLEDHSSYLTKPFGSSLETLEYPDVLQCYSPAVYSEGYKPYCSGKTVNKQMLVMENRFSAAELISTFYKNKLLDRKLASSIKEGLMTTNWSQRFLPEHDLLVGRSGKMMMLDKLLSSLLQQTARVLIVSYIKESLAVLEEFLKMRRWKYVRLEDGTYERARNDVPIYLMYAHSAVTDNFRFSIDSVVFFDHDWDTKLEDQKSKVLSKLGCQTRMNYYRLICQSTIEERMIKLAKETNIVSLTLSKDVFENKQVSSFPALKSLLSILLCELSQEKEWANETRNHPSQIELSSKMTLLNKDTTINLVKTLKYRKENDSLNHFKDGEDLLHYVNDNEVSDSASPSCSEDPEAYIDDEDNGRGVMGFQDDDNFSLSFDEGYMGMSPDSFEDVTIKSDYEEHSSPKKSRLGRGSGKRGRPPSRVRFHRRDICDGSDAIRRGPGRPRLKTVGPANQGTRGRKPGRPPLSKKAETISSGLASLSSGQNVFGFYSSPDLELS